MTQILEHSTAKRPKHTATENIYEEFTFFKLVVETVECLFFSWVEDVPAAERLLTIWNKITKLVKYWEALLKAKRPSSKSYMNVKGALSGLRQFLETESLLKMMKNAFYFTSKALFVLKIFKFLS